MSTQEIFFKPTHNLLSGYYIPVRNDWNYHIQKRHITEKEKNIYQEQFGEEIISDKEFFTWWKKVNNIDQ
ncbi:MAG: hypothetical protein KQH79_06645 [Bacteroidetes bacterium]|nr:hypothetical protein [Bacteroidota bacterium]